MSANQHEQYPYDTFSMALEAVILSCGGPKKVGAILWPEKNPEEAGKHLNRCLDEKSAARLNPKQLIQLLRMGRDRGQHAGINFITHVCGYAPPTTVYQEDERAQLHREFIEMSTRLEAMFHRVEALSEKATA